MKPAVYPGSFFIAHRLFTGAPFPDGGTWGDVLDGPITEESDLFEKIIEAFKLDVAGPSPENLRVWFIDPREGSYECTAWALKEVAEILFDRWA